MKEMERQRPITATRQLVRDLAYKSHEWPGRNRYFLPINEHQHFLKEEVVRTVMREAYPELDNYKLNKATRHICAHARKLFLILLYCGFCSTIRDFLNDDVTDEDLPFARVYSSGARDSNWTLGKKKHKNCQRNHDGDCGLSALTSWKRMEIIALGRDQWLVLAPIFSIYNDHIKHYDLEETTVLPYVRDQELEDGGMKSGGYSEVWGVKIHRAHQYLLPPSSNPSEPRIAVKRLFSRNPEEFNREYEMLSKLALKRHQHLIRLLATYKFREQYHFLFRYADLNLKTYWENFRLDWRNNEVSWVLKQLLGLASALHAIHEFKTAYPLRSDGKSSGVSRSGLAMNVGMQVDAQEELYGRHGDLKPENILWFKDIPGVGHGGILQITDLGLARFHRRESRSQQDPRTIGGSPIYIPPEIALVKLVSRSYDIWSLGCVFLEFITWMLDGNSGVTDFTHARRVVAYNNIPDDAFYTVYNDWPNKYAKVRPSVTTWIQKLRKHRKYSRMVKDLLDLVEDRMLRVDTKDRIRSGELVVKLEGIVWKGKKDSSYMLAGLVPPVVESNQSNQSIRYRY
ncbi:kinase-like protein [Stipitochalara longipes BDJ]|nr:kinase-like protein [Stipitochalara longipes BDJ]